MRNFNRRFPQKKFYTTNYHITAPELRVVDAEGKQVGVLSKEEAIKKAQDTEQDLILIAPQAKPPVAKIIDFKKFLYQEEKKLKEAKKGVRKSVTKDVKISLFIASADLERFIEKGKEFLSEGNQLRVNLALKGREMGKKDMALEVVRKYITALGDVSVSKEPRIEGRVVRAVVSRKK